MSYQLNTKQQEAVSHHEGPLLIVAGAGTGKTSVITQKIATLIKEKGVRPEEILALTFTDNAAQEMRERVDSMINTGYADLQISTFHAFCQQILEQYGLEIGIPNHMRLMTGTDSWLLLKQHIYKLGLDYYRPMGNPTQHIHALLKHFHKCKDELISPESYIAYTESLQADQDAVQDEEKSRYTELAHAYHTYNQLLLDQPALDFGDLIYYTVQLLEKRARVKERLQTQYKYILVDEFQDVNWSQYYLIRLLAGETGGNLTVVGDDDQSIYAFRGASVSNIMRFKEDFPHAKEVVLTENYRSAQEILDLSYTSIQHNNPDRLEVKLNIDKQLQAVNDKISAHVRIDHVHYAHLDDEVQGVAKEIKNLLSAGTNPDEIALLVRANSHAKPFMQAFDKHGIPYEFLSSQGLYYQPIITDCINFLRLTIDARNNNALYRLLIMPHSEMRADDLQSLTFNARKKSSYIFYALRDAEAYGLSQNGIAVARNLYTFISQGIQESKEKRVTEVLYHFLEESGYFSYLEKEEQAGNREALRSIRHLKQFFDVIDQFEQTTGEASVHHFMDYFESMLESGEQGQLAQPTDTPGSVNIMTVHGSKGLEFQHVFIVNMVEGRFPGRRRGGDIEIPEALIHEVLPEGDAHYQEERRLFYVAVTRAKQGLYFRSSDYYSEKRKAKVSRFLAELEYECIQATSLDKKELIAPPLAAKMDHPVLYQVPKSFSISQIHTFLNSPYQYKLEHILKIPQRGSHHFSFGNTMHLTLQKFYTDIQTRSRATQASLFEMRKEKNDEAAMPLDQLLSLYEETWIAEWYQSKKQHDEYFAKGKEMLRTYYAHHDGNWRIPEIIEGGFSVKLGEYTVRGKIDRMDLREDGTLEIIDYKTGKPKEKVAGQDKDQLLLYQIAAESLPKYHHIGPVGALTYYYLRNDSTCSFLGTQKEKEKLEQKLIEAIQKIHDTDWSQIGPEDVSYFDQP